MNADHGRRVNHARGLMADLVNDFRASDGEYQQWCRRAIQALYKARHGIRMDQYGWPTLPEFRT